MWRGYGDGGGGVAIEFNTEKLKADQSSPFIVRKIEHLCETALEDWINKKLTNLRDLLVRLSLMNN
jgi:hypothetical protein